MQIFKAESDRLTKYLFYTGKGGVGKTSLACATAVALADEGKTVLLVSTDPASNLQDVFSEPLDGNGVPIKDVPNLKVANLDPMQSAAAYREAVVGPYRGLLPDAAIRNMEEQLSGSCTVEIAAFNAFAHILTDVGTARSHDHIIFDTAPTGHTLRLLQLPSAWSDFINENTHGASCLGQLSGLESQREMYAQAVKTLADATLTTLLLVSRPEETPLREAERASRELAELGVNNQILVLNSMLIGHDDAVSDRLFNKQQQALMAMPQRLKDIMTYFVPMRAYNIIGIENVRSMLKEDKFTSPSNRFERGRIRTLGDVVEDLHQSGKKVVFTMGKGGVGKTTLAAAIALGLAERGQRVHLTTTDPAAHLKYVLDAHEGITLSHLDEAKELEKYKQEVLGKAISAGSSEADIAYIQEDLRSPCTQEIAVFRAFADIVEKADDQVVVIDTAPTGHTLLLLDSTQSYSMEVERSSGDIPDSVRKLLPRLRDETQTAVVIVTLPEATPYYEAKRLEEDLGRAGIKTKWWIINSSLYKAGSSNRLIKAKADNEVEWIDKIHIHTQQHAALVGWIAEEAKGSNLLTLVG